MSGFNYGGFGDGSGWSSESGSGSTPGGGSTGNSGNHSGNGASANNPAFVSQITSIQNDVSVRQRLIELVQVARQFNPSAKITITNVSAKGTLSIAITGITTDQAKTAGLGGLVMGVNNNEVTVGDFETGYTLTDSSTSGNNGGDSFLDILLGNKGPSGQALVLNNGQMGYWEQRVVSGAEHDRTVKVFVSVGPSEAAKQAAANKQAQEKQQAAMAAQDFANKIKAAADTAEKQRQDAVNAAIAAGQHQSVSEAQHNLDVSAQEVSSLKSVLDNALSQLQSKRQEATNASIAAVQAEQANQSLLQAIEQKRRGKKLIERNGQLGYEEAQLHETANHSYLRNVFVAIGISVDQRNNAQANAVNKRNTANQLAAAVTAAEQASLLASVNYNNAETRRQAAVAALNAAQQAAAYAEEVERQRKEAEAIAAEAAEQKRLADEAAKVAEEARVAAEAAKAKQAREAAFNKLKSTDIQSVRGISVADSARSMPLSWAVASRGGMALGGDVVGEMATKIVSIIARLEGAAVSTLLGPVAATAAMLLFPSQAGDPSDSVVPGRDISSLMPGDILSLPDNVVLNEAADQHTGVDMPVRGRLLVGDDGSLTTEMVRTPAPGKVSVVRAVLDEETGYWGYTVPAMSDVPSQTILISPSDAPGVGGPLGLTGPVPLPEKIFHTGDQVEVPSGTQVTITPVADDLEFDDVILIFPVESGLKPLYVMLRSRRNMPGTASGNGQNVGDNWLNGASTGEGAPIPSQIADKLRGREFGSFDSFRRAFWKEVASDPELSKQFTNDDIELMKHGYAPIVGFKDRAGKRVKIELHHKVAIYKGGDVYNVDNLNALTPKHHIEVHKGN